MVAGLGVPEHAPGDPPGAHRAAGQPHRHQQRNRVVHAPMGDEHRQERRRGDQLSRQAEVPVTRRPRPALLPRKRPEAEEQRVVGAHAHAVLALHAAGVGHHAVVAHLLVHAHVGSAHRGAVTALVARVRDADPPRRHAVRRAEDRPVGAAVGAEALRAQEVDGREPAHGQERHGHPQGRERLPERAGREGQGEAPERGRRVQPVGHRGQPRLQRRNQRALEGRPREHVDGDAQRDPDQQPRAERPRPDAGAPHQPAAEVLQRDQVAAPAAHEAAEQRGGEDRQCEEHEAGVDPAQLQRLHRLGRLHRSERAAGGQPVGDVGEDEDVDEPQHDGAAPSGAGLADRPVHARLPGEHREGIARADGLVRSGGAAGSFRHRPRIVAGHA